jgi:hypothetical protein
MTVNTMLKPSTELLSRWITEAPGEFSVSLETFQYIATVAANWGAQRYKQLQGDELNGNG